jgi:hypothetical protein
MRDEGETAVSASTPSPLPLGLIIGLVFLRAISHRCSARSSCVSIRGQEQQLSAF